MQDTIAKNHSVKANFWSLGCRNAKIHINHVTDLEARKDKRKKRNRQADRSLMSRSPKYNALKDEF